MDYRFPHRVYSGRTSLNSSLSVNSLSKVSLSRSELLFSVRKSKGREYALQGRRIAVHRCAPEPEEADPAQLDTSLWPPVRRPFQHWIHSPRRVIGLFPEWFALPQPDWPASLRLTGFPQYDESDQQGLSPELEAFLDAEDPPIVFTPGSANQHAASFFKAAVDASNRLGRRALLLSRYTTHLPPLPSTVRHESYVPLSRLLPRCAALVHHSGIGTSAQALAAGIPQLTMPMGFDQPDNTTRLHRLGVAAWLTSSQFTGEQVTAKLEKLLTDPKVASSCKRWSDELKENPALDRTCRLLEELG